MANFFDQFDPPKSGNFFDQFDPPSQPKAPEPRSDWENFKAGVGAIWDDPKLALGVGPAKMVTDAAKSVVSAATLPGDIYTGKEGIGQVPSQMTAEQGKRVADMAMIANPINPMVRAGDLAIPGVRQVVM